MAQLRQEWSAGTVRRRERSADPLPARAPPATALPPLARRRVSLPPRAVEKRHCSATIGVSGQLKKRPCGRSRVRRKSRVWSLRRGSWKNVRERPETRAPRIDLVVRHFNRRRRRDSSWPCQQRSQRRHDWHGFQSRARYQTRWHARASLYGCQPMSVQHRPDYLAERALGPESSARHIRLFRRQPVVQRQRFGRSPAAALTPLSRRHRRLMRRRLVRAFMR
jgi:hypothetical protein